MKRILALILVCALLLTSCGQGSLQDTSSSEVPSSTESTPVSEASPVTTAADPSPSISEPPAVPEYPNLNDPELLRYMEDNIYQECVSSLNSSDYFVENVSAIYVSKEYLEELSYNSKENIFFGYTLAELDEQFQGTRYVFTLGDSGETIVEPFEENADPYEQILKNVVIGSGVILVCVTVSTVSAGLGAPAVSMIFSMSAKMGTTAALSSGAFGGISAGILTGIQTGNFDAAMEAAALSASEGFKWGAISGAISGGVTEAVALKGATLHGLTMNEAAMIQRESGYPLDVIKEFASVEQYNICQEAGLSQSIVNGKSALIRDIDLNFVDEMGRTNLERMQQGLAALDPATGNAYQLHHVGQRVDSTLAILTEAEHMQGGNNSIWHVFGNPSETHAPGNNWDAQRKAFWKAMADMLS